jgi:hypothetical protein
MENKIIKKNLLKNMKLTELSINMFNKNKKNLFN